MIEFLQGFDQQVVDGEPDGTAPVGVAAEKPAARFGRLVADGMGLAIYVEGVGMVLVIFGNRADTISSSSYSKS